MPAAAAMSSTVVSSKPCRANRVKATRSIAARELTGGRPATPTLWTVVAPCANIWRMTAVAPDHPAPAPADVDADTMLDEAGGDDLVLADLLVEEISIDGMCGVY